MNQFYGAPPPPLKILIFWIQGRLCNSKAPKITPKPSRTDENLVFGLFIPRLKSRNEKSKNQKIEKMPLLRNRRTGDKLETLKIKKMSLAVLGVSRDQIMGNSGHLTRIFVPHHFQTSRPPQTPPENQKT